jgi:hypothetical protein
MNTSLSPLIGGVLGTIIMTLALLLPKWLGFGRVDVIRAVGSLITRRAHGTFVSGLAVHLCSGIIFAYIYQFILSLSFIPLNALTGLMMGTLHGAIIMLLVSITIMEHHPIAHYHTRGPATGVAQLLAHMIYGLVVGSIVQFLS